MFFHEKTSKTASPRSIGAEDVMKKIKKPPKKLAKKLPPTKSEKTTLREDIGKVLIDVGKLIFGSIFLGSILRGEIPQAILAISGFVTAVALLVAGVLLVRKEKKSGENDSAPEKKE
jgi:hypothetical protein